MDIVVFKNEELFETFWKYFSSSSIVKHSTSANYRGRKSNIEIIWLVDNDFSIKIRPEYKLLFVGTEHDEPFFTTFIKSQKLKNEMSFTLLKEYSRPDFINAVIHQNSNQKFTFSDGPTLGELEKIYSERLSRFLSSEGIFKGNTLLRYSDFQFLNSISATAYPVLYEYENTGIYFTPENNQSPIVKQVVVSLSHFERVTKNYQCLAPLPTTQSIISKLLQTNHYELNHILVALEFLASEGFINKALTVGTLCPTKHKTLLIDILHSYSNNEEDFSIPDNILSEQDSEDIALLPLRVLKDDSVEIDVVSQIVYEAIIDDLKLSLSQTELAYSERTLTAQTKDGCKFSAQTKVFLAPEHEYLQSFENLPVGFIPKKKHPIEGAQGFLKLSNINSYSVLDLADSIPDLTPLVIFERLAYLAKEKIILFDKNKKFLFQLGACNEVFRWEDLLLVEIHQKYCQLLDGCENVGDILSAYKKELDDKFNDLSISTSKNQESNPAQELLGDNNTYDESKAEDNLDDFEPINSSFTSQNTRLLKKTSEGCLELNNSDEIIAPEVTPKNNSDEIIAPEVTPKNNSDEITPPEVTPKNNLDEITPLENTHKLIKIVLCAVILCLVVQVFTVGYLIKKEYKDTKTSPSMNEVNIEKGPRPSAATLNRELNEILMSIEGTSNKYEHNKN
ncbi:MAG: hypothetical protein HRT88_00790 [Lentisphaeraceae bacterium]|nr:hypothetical protein [Lentisphaeraceae bacterium]